MSLNILVPQIFIPLSSVKLGRFINNIEHPHQSYDDPAYAHPPKSIIVHHEAFTGTGNSSHAATFGSALTALLSVSFSKRAKRRVEVKADSVKTYILDHSDEYFAEAMGLLATQTWLRWLLIRARLFI